MSDLPMVSGDGRDALLEFHATGEGGNAKRPPALADVLREGAEGLQEEVADLGATLAPGARAVLELYTAAAAAEREAAEARLLDELRGLVERLSRHLQLDASHGPEGSSSETLSGALGKAGDAIDTDRLSRLLPEHRGAKRLSPERRARLEQAGALLRGRLERKTVEPAVVLLHSGTLPQGLDRAGIEAVETADGLAEAPAMFDGAVAGVTELLRAVRLVRLELEGAFEPGRHDRALTRFDWRAAAPGELALFPHVVVLEHADRVRAEGIGGLSALLMSGRPVHVLLVERPLPRIEPTPLPRLEIGYLAAAHREAFVLQSTLARPAHLAEGLQQLVRSPRSALAIVAAPPPGDETPAAVELAAAHEGRSVPCFRFDPEAGDTWAACLRLDGNPQPEAEWPVHEVRHVDDDGVERELREAFTLAHAMALTAAGRRQLRRVPRTAWADDQVEIAAYLRLDDADRRGKLPFVWLLDDDRRLARAVVSRALAAECRQRLASWRVLQELAGVDNVHALRAAERVRSEVESRAGQTERRLVAQHEEELARVRDEAGQDAVARIVHALLDFDGTFPVETGQGAPAAAAPIAAQPPAAEVVEGPPPPAADQPGPAVVEPYIDTPLCTTCNECTNLNSQMFRYNEDKQAYIADTSAGTFAQLVKAAEKCPARCIHPGVPRNGDRTANDRLLARAAKFN